MAVKDIRGLSLTGATPEALDPFERAVSELQCYRGDPVASVDAALAAAPGFVMAHALKAWLHLLGTEAAALPVARACRQAGQAAAGGASSREIGHLAAIGHMSEGRFLEAGRVLEDVTIDEPLDLLGLIAGHQIDFFTGRARMLRDRIGRSLPRWDESVPGYHSVLGMHAFGLEEMGDYARAEAEGRRGVELESKDGWSQHAVAHVLEMQGRQADGVNWMVANKDGWAGDSFLQVHNWWHLALYYLDVSDFDAALALFDGEMGGGRSSVVLDMVDGSALLWRLHLRGVPVGDRWERVADAWAPVAGDGNYAFNDAHAIMAFIGAGRPDKVAEVLDAQAAAMNRDTDNAVATRQVGRAVAEGLIAFGAGDYAACLRHLRPVREIAPLFGGSHAQRDVLDLTMIEAAYRLGNGPLARALAAERVEAKHESPLAQLLARRVAA